MAHILAAQLPLPGGHTLLGQDIARQRGRHLQFKALAVGFHLAAQHAVHPAVAQLVIHTQAVVLPAVTRLFFGQGHRFKGRLCRLCQTAQVLLGPFFFHNFSPSSAHTALPYAVCHFQFPASLRETLCSLYRKFLCHSVAAVMPCRTANKKRYNAALL